MKMYVITIVNTETGSVKSFIPKHFEEIEESQDDLEDNEMLFVNEYEKRRENSRRRMDI